MHKIVNTVTGLEWNSAIQGWREHGDGIPAEKIQIAFADMPDHEKANAEMVEA